MIFFTDLDNTIIYSYRHTTSEQIVWIERLNDKPQSFITEKTYSYFSQQKWLKIVPVTTRTLSQYMRLMGSLSSLGWNEALICNGALRIVNGVEDIEWTRESVFLSERSQASFKKAYDYAVRFYGKDVLVLCDPFLFYIKTNDVDKVYKALTEIADKDNLTVYKDSRKVYCIPDSLNKGQTIKRYKSRFQIKKCIAAGDSCFDVPMLRQADICLFPDSLSSFGASGEKHICSDMFSNQICEELEKIREKRICCD